MGHHAVIGDISKHKLAPRVSVTARETPGQVARRAATMAGPVTVTKVNVTMPDATTAEKRDGATRQGTTTNGTRNGATGWRKIPGYANRYMINVSMTGTRGAVLTVMPQLVKGKTYWVARLVVTGSKPVVLGNLTRETAFDPSKISAECMSAAQVAARKLGWEAK